MKDNTLSPAAVLFWIYLFHAFRHFLYPSVRDSVQFSSVAQSCPTLCDPMNRSMPGLSVHHQLPEFTQTHVHQVSDAIRPSHPLLISWPHSPKPTLSVSLLTSFSCFLWDCTVFRFCCLSLLHSSEALPFLLSFHPLLLLLSHFSHIRLCVTL